MAYFSGAIGSVQVLEKLRRQRPRTRDPGPCTSRDSESFHRPQPCATKKKGPGYLESWLVDKEIRMSLNMMISMISTLVPSMPSISNQFFVFRAELKKDAQLKKWFGFLVPQFSGRKSFSPPKTKQALAELYFRQRRVPPNQLPIAKPGPS